MSSAALYHGYHAGAGGASALRWKSWLPAVLLVLLLHAGVWSAYTAWQNRQPAMPPLPSVQISLISLPAPQAEPAPRPRAPVPPEPQPAPAQQPLTAPPIATQSIATPPLEAADNSDDAPREAQPEYSQPLYNAAYLNNPPPLYPLAARRRGIEGTVVVRAQIMEDGHCLQAQLSKSSGHQMLDTAAVAAVKSWRFVPAKRGAQTITAWVEVPITFRLTRQDEQS